MRTCVPPMCRGQDFADNGVTAAKSDEPTARFDLFFRELCACAFCVSISSCAVFFALTAAVCHRRRVHRHVRARRRRPFARCSSLHRRSRIVREPCRSPATRGCCVCVLSRRYGLACSLTRELQETTRARLTKWVLQYLAKPRSVKANRRDLFLPAEALALLVRVAQGPAPWHVVVADEGNARFADKTAIRQRRGGRQDHYHTVARTSHALCWVDAARQDRGDCHRPASGHVL